MVYDRKIFDGGSTYYRTIKKSTMHSIVVYQNDFTVTTEKHPVHQTKAPILSSTNATKYTIYDNPGRVTLLDNFSELFIQNCVF